MPIPVFLKAVFDGLSSIPHAATILKQVPWLVLLYFLKVYFQGASNRSERNMHSKVIMVTGGTSGIGSEVVRELATRGAQIVLLTQHPVGDPFLVDYIEDLRSSTDNHLITAEQVDLASLHSIRTFATKWIDNAPPRRLDMIILCANTLTPRGGKLQSTQDDVEINWGINYLANFHLLSILSPAIRAQPPDRDVRIIMGTCASFLGGELPVQAETSSEATNGSTKKNKKNPSVTAAQQQDTTAFSPSSAYASSKLSLMTFAYAFQKHLSSYKRPDQAPMTARVVLVDPGFTRTPGMRRYLSWGSLFGLALYLVMYPIWWMLLKSPDMGAQSFLFAAMEAEIAKIGGCSLIKECRPVKMTKEQALDEALQKALWEYSESMVAEAEKRGALARSKAKREADADEKVPKGEPKAQAKSKSDVDKEKAKENVTKPNGSRRSRKAG